MYNILVNISQNVDIIVFPPVFVTVHWFWPLAHWQFCYNGVESSYPLRVWGAKRSSGSITVHPIALSRSAPEVSNCLYLPALNVYLERCLCFTSLEVKEVKSPLLSLEGWSWFCPPLLDSFNPSLLLLLGYNSASLLMRLPSLPDCEPLWEYQQLLLLYFYPPAPNILPGMCWLLNYYLLNWLMLLWRHTSTEPN